MKKYKYIGEFRYRNEDSDYYVNYQDVVYCNSFLQAFILLTANAIKNGKYSQLFYIHLMEKGDIKKSVLVSDIKKINELFTEI